MEQPLAFTSHYAHLEKIPLGTTDIPKSLDSKYCSKQVPPTYTLYNVPSPPSLRRAEQEAQNEQVSMVCSVTIQ